MNSQIKLILDSDGIARQEVLVDQITHRGCCFQWAGDDTSVFRENCDSAGRFSSFGMRMVFSVPSMGSVQLVTEGQVAGVHRCAQSEYQIKLNFKNMQQDGYRLIAEYLASQEDSMAGNGSLNDQDDYLDARSA